MVRRGVRPTTQTWKQQGISIVMTFHRAINLALVIVFSFFGGLAAQSIANGTISEAFAAIQANGKMVSKGQDSGFLQFYDSNQKARLDVGVFANNPLQNFYGTDGKLRLQFGTYTAPGEAGLPLAAFSDNAGEIRLLLRLAGSNESPVLVFKDKQHRDRMVIGLGMNDSMQEPFLAYFDNDGNKHMAFGQY